MACSMVLAQRRRLSAPGHDHAPSKLYILTAASHEGESVACSVCSSFQKLNPKKFNGNLSASYTSQRLRFPVKAGLQGIPLESDGEPSSSSPESTWKSIKHGVDVFYKFIKPYVILAKLIEVLSMSLLATDKFSDFSLLYAEGVLKAMAAGAFMCIYIIVLNQLTDIEIDKINKPYRPLATGEYSYTTGSLIAAFSAILCLGIAWSERSLALLSLQICLLVLGTLYSVTIDLPVLKWRRSAFSAAMWTGIFYGIIQPVSYILHFQTHLLKKTFTFSKSLMCTSAFMSILSIILMVVKDIPDIEGDRKFGIESFAMRFGQKRVFWICVVVLEMVYGAAICVGAMSPSPWSKLIAILGHSVMGVKLWNCAKKTDIAKQESVEAFYMLVSKLFAAEYLIIPFIRL